MKVWLRHWPETEQSLHVERACLPYQIFFQRYCNPPLLKTTNKKILASVWLLNEKKACTTCASKKKSCKLQPPPQKLQPPPQISNGPSLIGCLLAIEPTDWQIYRRMFAACWFPFCRGTESGSTGTTAYDSHWVKANFHSGKLPVDWNGQENFSLSCELWVGTNDFNTKKNFLVRSNPRIIFLSGNYPLGIINCTWNL